MTLAEAASVRCQTWRLEVSVFLASAVAAHTACRIRPMSWGRHRCCFGVPPTWRVDAPRAKRTSTHILVTVRADAIEGPQQTITKEVFRGQFNGGLGSQFRGST